METFKMFRVNQRNPFFEKKKLKSTNAGPREAKNVPNLFCGFTSKAAQVKILPGGR